ncbi:hypothetical protein [Flavobacterium sp. N2270]|uniref:hypothetical protein n=1 Tax=Flavobacterium sp. N2270 TaxID=2986831 RepID=UPI00222547D6|nr:hypothetical protein [Flavobacterium sp. N2270]
MKLSKESIQSIDNYLKHEGFVYVDIRMEMVDHVANAVEEKMEVENLNFYDAFKSYMIAHKKEIMKQSKTDSKSQYSLHSIKHFLFFLAKPFNVVLGLLLFFVIKFGGINEFFSKAFTFGNLFFIIIMCLALFQVIYFHVYLKERFYYIEKLGGILAIIYYLQLFLSPTFKSTNSPYIFTVFSYVIIAYMFYFIKTVVKFNSFKKNYLYETK